jgi:phage-related protein
MDLFDLVAKISLDSSEYEKGVEKAKSGAESFREAWTKGKGQIASGAKNIGIGAGALAGLGAAAFKAADSVSKNLDEIDKSSQKLGISAKAYQEWDFVLEHSGADINSLNAGMKTLTSKLDAAKKGNADAIKSFEKLGLSLEDVSDMSQEDLFASVVTGFQEMGESAERTKLATELLGRSGMELGPLFNTTAEDTAAMIQQINDLGGVMSDDAVKNGAAFQDSITNVKAALSGAGATLAAELIPAITKLATKFSEFVANGGLDKVIDLFKTLAPVIGAVVVGFAGFKIVSGIISVIQGVTTVFGALNAVMLANPIGIVIAAVAALVAAFVLLWNNCEGFRNFFINMWEGIVNTATAAWEGIKNAFSAVGEWFSEKFTAAKEAVNSAWSNIKEKMSERWGQIKEAFADVGGWFSEKFGKAKENALSAWNNIKEKAAEIWSLFKDGFTISDALNWGKDMIQNFIDGIKEKWENLKSTISGIGQTIKDFLGFSEPKEGPLSNFHTFAPDMMKLFAKGIADNEHLVTDQLSKSFDFGDYAISGTVQAGGAYGSGAASGRTIIGFDIDTDGLVRYLRPYIKDEDSRIGGAMVV